MLKNLHSVEGSIFILKIHMCNKFFWDAQYLPKKKKKLKNILIGSDVCQEWKLMNSLLESLFYPRFPSFSFPVPS